MSAFVIALALAAAAPQSTPDQQDALCVAGVTRLQSSLPEEQREALSGVLLYYLGKLAGRNVPEKVRTLIDEAEADAARAGTDINRTVRECAGELEAFSTMLED